uniref:Uncharacterized protein n=1 Tax=Sphaerodactylus townsendi TaxID=933632 RepID=A0ACB8EFQ6_9SAUR
MSVIGYSEACLQSQNSWVSGILQKAWFTHAEKGTRENTEGHYGPHYFRQQVAVHSWKHSPVSKAPYQMKSQLCKPTEIVETFLPAVLVFCLWGRGFFLMQRDIQY